MKKISLIIILASIILVPILVEAKESPELPLSLYGRVNIFNSPAGPGTQITFLDPRGNACGTFSTQQSGRFGLLNCIYYNTTGDERGALPGEPLQARVNGQPASVLLGHNLDSLGTVNWSSGDFKEIIIVRPPLVCGDGFCDNYESCHSCPEDCGPCLEEDIDDDDFEIEFPEEPLPPEPIIEEPCDELWSCATWGECQEGDFQERECVDLNECGTENEKPDTERYCEYVEETEPVEEEPREVTPRPEEPREVTFCPDRMPITSFPSLTFISFIFLLILGKILLYKRTVKKAKENKELDDVEVLKKEYIGKRRTYVFVTTVLALAIIVYLYHYFFYMCEDLYIEHVWLLLIFVVLSPIIIYLVLILLRFTEKDLKKKMLLFNDTHYQHVLKLVVIINSQLSTSEKEISKSLKELDKDKEFHALMNEIKSLKVIYKDLNKLRTIYKEGKEATKVEKELLENINELIEDEKFNEEIENIPGLGNLKNNLSALYKSYEYKQDLYDEMIKIEEEYEGKEPEIVEPEESKSEEKKDNGKEKADESEKDKKGGGE